MPRILGITRYAVFIPAIASIIGALLLMVQGSIEMGIVVYKAIVSDYVLKESIVDVLTAVDAILLGTVLLVIGYGLYELFIDSEIPVPAWLRVKDLGIGSGALVLALAAFSWASRKGGSGGPKGKLDP